VPSEALAAATGEWAKTLDALDRLTEADALRNEALDTARRSVGDDDPLVARLLHDRDASLHLSSAAIR
jgi:hypothetical protein